MNTHILQELAAHLNKINSKLSAIQEANGRIEARQIGAMTSHGFRVYSQWDEDGIIQDLISKVKIPRPVFIEFGVENYEESNTRFLMINNNWSGLVLDGNPNNVTNIRNQDIYWRHNLKAEYAFITRDNINNIILKAGLKDEIGLLSIDIDGNDYWVWEAIKCVSPAIVVCEYNAIFGGKAKVTVPYAPDFIRQKYHYSHLYFGASLGALCHLGKSKGYALVAINSGRNNAFFVRNDLLGNLPEKTVEELFLPFQFRESRDQQGQLSFLDYDQAQSLLADMPLIDITTGEIAFLRSYL